MQKISDKKDFKKKVLQLKMDTLEMLNKAGSGHIGGGYGMADIWVALYYGILNYDSSNPDWVERDYMLLSNGHTCPIWYATLADVGFFSKSELNNLRKIDSLLQGHPKVMIPGVENSSGPLGHGLSQAIGIALGLKVDKKDNRVYCFVSDGEQQEGQNWEAAMSASKWKLDNLIAIMDNNGVQIEGTTDEIMPLGDIAGKYRAFGWEVIEIDGHDYDQIEKAFEDAIKVSGKPVMIIANTVSGKGISFMENDPGFHDWKGEEGDYEKAKVELEEALNSLG
jgi:transketolase